MYPQRVRNARDSSGTATACTKLFSKHLRGRGFKNQNLEKLVVNEYGQTLGDIHKLICDDRAMFPSFAIHITYNPLLQPISIKHVPWEVVRLSLPDDNGNILTAKMHPDWARESGKPFKKENIVEVDLYTNDLDTMFEQIERAGGYDKWNGHLLYFSEAGINTYPSAVFDPVFEDVLTDAGIKMWKFRGISTDFMASYFWLVNGEFGTDEERDEYVGALNSYQGVDQSHKVIVVENPLPNSKPEVVKIEKQDNDKVYELTETTVRENIIRLYGQPLALHAIKVQGQLGLSKEWEEAKINYDERTADEREKIGSAFKDILDNWAFGNPAADGDYTVVPLTGLQEQKKVTPIGQVLEVGKLQSVQMVITDPNMGTNQKVNFLVAIYGIKKEVAEAIVNGTELPTELIENV
jgi:hypothetical protein